MTPNHDTKIEVHRKLCIKKDLDELNVWLGNLEQFNHELDQWHIIEQQLIKNRSIASTIQALRRKNVLNMASFCKYEKQLHTEFEYGSTIYDINRSKMHDRKREHYVQLIGEFSSFKNHMLKVLQNYQRHG